ncbi:MAG TPA: DoxX family protein [Parvularculaceae bacterium]|nr:DoxX family protein [Parvularculaceae bacterium]
MRAIYAAFARIAEKIPYALTALACRGAAAVPFWRSGQSKLDGGAIFGVKYDVLHVKASKIYLFAEQFHFPEKIAPAAAHLAALGENILPPLLIIGFLSRFAAAGLLVMTAVIQFYVFPGELLNPNGNWAEHLSWAAPLLVVLSMGPGAISADRLFGGAQKKSTLLS